MGAVQTARYVGKEIAWRGADAVVSGIRLPYRATRFLTAAVLNELCKPPHVPTLIAAQYVQSAKTAKSLIVIAAHNDLPDAVAESEDLLARTLVEARMHPLVSESDLGAVASEVNPRYFHPEGNPHVPPYIAVAAQEIVRQAVAPSE